MVLPPSASRWKASAARLPPLIDALHSSKMNLPLAGGYQPGTAVSLGRNVYPQKHDQEDEDRIRHDPHDVGSPTPSLLYSLLAHGGSSLGPQCMGPPLSLPPNGWTGPWGGPELF